MSMSKDFLFGVKEGEGYGDWSADVDEDYDYEDYEDESEICEGCGELIDECICGEEECEDDFDEE